ncbi:hypothetical protein V865_007168 [Kwoniella europaea PYCC6329]|uniref:Uncharacterized protein n=1 Tax=Kwoniella europaea PYCC6329 TaxID=1423913 RepID=A0AAX4KTG7_9TREE
MTSLVQSPTPIDHHPTSPPDDLLQTPSEEVPRHPPQAGEELSSSLGVIRRTTIPFLARNRFSRFITSPSPSPSPKNGDVPFPRQPNTPSPAPTISLSHLDGKNTSSNESYALSNDPALMDFFKGSLEVTPLPQFEDNDSQSYFVGWDQTIETPQRARHEQGTCQGGVSETEAGWSRSGVRGWSFVGKAWSDERRDDKAERGGWGWLTV